MMLIKVTKRPQIQFQNQSDTISPWLEALQNLDPNYPDVWMRGQFDCYVKQITGHFLAFDRAEKASIQLMHTL